jgi:hypothetical protein
MAISIGDLYCSLRDELDLDHESQERVTDVDETYISIVCDATGGWINPTVEELAQDFCKL